MQDFSDFLRLHAKNPAIGRQFPLSVSLIKICLCIIIVSSVVLYAIDWLFHQMY